MRVLWWLREKVLGASPPPPRAMPDCTDAQQFAWLQPPADLRSAAAWDEYHYLHLTHGFGPPFFDIFSHDHELVGAMNRLRLRTVLCAGSGLAVEPLALAAAGFAVTALDLSERALHLIKSVTPPSGFTRSFFDDHELRPGGTIEWVCGDIIDMTCCPGPFDLIIERRTAQNYPDLSVILEPLVARLSPEGILFSQCHDGGWRPPNPRRHRVGDWLRDHGWPTWNGAGEKPAGRVAWLMTTTG